MALASLAFLSGIVGVARSPLSSGSCDPENGRSAAGSRLATAVGLLAGVFGLISACLIAAFPLIIYSGFLGWLHLTLWQRLLMHAPLALAIVCCALLPLAVLAWHRRWWSLSRRIHLSTVAAAAAAATLLLASWGMIGLALVEKSPMMDSPDVQVTRSASGRCGDCRIASESSLEYPSEGRAALVHCAPHDALHDHRPREWPPTREGRRCLRSRACSPGSGWRSGPPFAQSCSTASGGEAVGRESRLSGACPGRFAGR